MTKRSENWEAVIGDESGIGRVTSGRVNSDQPTDDVWKVSRGAEAGGRPASKARGRPWTSRPGGEQLVRKVYSQLLVFYWSHLSIFAFACILIGHIRARCCNATFSMCLGLQHFRARLCEQVVGLRSQKVACFGDASRSRPP
jgi:hypothetical protein